MKDLSPRVARILSILLSLALLAVTAESLRYLLEYGSGFWHRMKPSDVSGTFDVAALLFLIGATDVPAAMRRSKHLRVQLQCWTIWLALVAAVFYAKSEGFSSPAGIVFGLTASVLAAYSLVALFWPHDVLSL